MWCSTFNLFIYDDVTACNVPKCSFRDVMLSNGPEGGDKVICSILEVHTRLSIPRNNNNRKKHTAQKCGTGNKVTTCGYVTKESPGPTRDQNRRWNWLAYPFMYGNIVSICLTHRKLDHRKCLTRSNAWIKHVDLSCLWKELNVLLKLNLILNNLELVLIVLRSASVLICSTLIKRHHFVYL